jgi:hypothetical protein
LHAPFKSQQRKRCVCAKALVSAHSSPEKHSATNASGYYKTPNAGLPHQMSMLITAAAGAGLVLMAVLVVQCCFYVSSSPGGSLWFARQTITCNSKLQLLVAATSCPAKSPIGHSCCRTAGVLHQLSHLLLLAAATAAVVHQLSHLLLYRPILLLLLLLLLNTEIQASPALCRHRHSCRTL